MAVLGNGASGIQIVPALQPGKKQHTIYHDAPYSYAALEVDKLVHVIRSPTWIVPPQRQLIAASPSAPFIASIKMDAEENFAEEQIEEFKSDPKKYMKFVKTVEYELNSKFKVVRTALFELS